MAIRPNQHEPSQLGPVLHDPAGEPVQAVELFDLQELGRGQHLQAVGDVGDVSIDREHEGACRGA